MYTEWQMRGRIRRLALPLLRSGGFDIPVTHAPARHINDFESVPHRGFECFNDLLRRYEPALFIHGHVHRNDGVNIPQRTPAGRTTVINAFGYCAVEYGESGGNLKEELSMRRLLGWQRIQ